MLRISYQFFIGIFMGIAMTLLFTETTVMRYRYELNEMRNIKEKNQVQFDDLEDKDDDFHAHEYPLEKEQEQQSEDGHIHEGNRIIDSLHKNVRVLCWIMTHPVEKNIRKVKAVNQTWTQRCNKVIYFSTFGNLSVETVDLKFQEGRNHLWGKTKKVLTYLFQNYGHEYDWFFKADDDTFAIMENLRLLLANYSPDEKRMLGCSFHLNKMFYNSGGAGYVLSRRALLTFVEEGIHHPKCPKGEGGSEDYNLGRCMNAIGVNVTDTRDATKKFRFLPLSASDMLMNRIPSWLPKYVTGTVGKGADCCSELLISFHYIGPEMMYLLEFFTYHVHVYGRPNKYTVPDSTKDSELWNSIVSDSKQSFPH